MKRSNYQEAICKHIGNRQGNAAIIAVAGSGKTHTAIEAVSEISQLYEVLMGAFNKDIQLEFDRRLKDKNIRHVKPMTFNGFGWKICMENARPKLDKDKTEKVLRFTIMRPDTEPKTKLFYAWRNNIIRLVSLFKNLNIQTWAEAVVRYDEVVARFGIECSTSPDFKTTVLSTFEHCIKDTDIMDYDDQKYMPLHHGWHIPKFDTVILDEFQDTCMVEMELMLAANGGQMYCFGDPDQSIYGFKGATPDAFALFCERLKAKELPLSICYRCPVAVINQAKKIVPRIEAAPGAKQGYVGTKKRYECKFEPHDFVLCRTTAPLVKDCLQQINAGKKAKVRGRQFGEAMCYTIDRVGNDQMNMDTFIGKVRDYRTARIEDLKRYGREREIQELDDRIDTIFELTMGCQIVADIKRRIADVFTDQPHNGIDYMTIHKSKGLQAKNVFVLRPDLSPHPKSKKDWQIQEENRLMYVRDTRAEENLIYIEPEKS